jgi:hypothetical protein
MIVAAVYADLLAISHARLRVTAVRMNLLPLGYPSLGMAAVGVSLLPGRHPSLGPVGMLAVLRPLERGHTLGVLRPREALRAHCVAASAATAAAALRLGALASATASAAMVHESLLALLSTATMTAVRPRIRRGCDRQRGNAGCEKDPGHHNFSFERQQRPVRRTVPTVKRMEPAPYRTSVNLKLLDCSDS